MLAAFPGSWRGGGGSGGTLQCHCVSGVLALPSRELSVSMSTISPCRSGGGTGEGPLGPAGPWASVTHCAPLSPSRPAPGAQAGTRRQRVKVEAGITCRTVAPQRSGPQMDSTRQTCSIIGGPGQGAVPQGNHGACGGPSRGEKEAPLATGCFPVSLLCHRDLAVPTTSRPERGGTARAVGGPGTRGRGPGSQPTPLSCLRGLRAPPPASRTGGPLWGSLRLSASFGTATRLQCALLWEKRTQDAGESLQKLWSVCSSCPDLGVSLRHQM